MHSILFTEFMPFLRFVGHQQNDSHILNHTVNRNSKVDLIPVENNERLLFVK